ncbi:MAG TPA: PAS domain-containing protein [Mucilaginibacter sp.]|nr:PAS domain-containing protein [Mucilaginibacter sp.]
MIQSLKILHIEDVQSDAELVERTLKKSGIAFEKRIVDGKEEYIKALEEFNPDVILSDHSLPAFDSLDALRILKQTGRTIPFILITATVSEEFAVSVMKEGASDYVLKDRLQRLPNAVLNAVGKYRSDNERQVYLDKIFASEELFTKAELLAEFGTWRIDLATDTTNWSAGTYKLFGYRQGEVEPSYENFLKNVHPDDVVEVARNFKNAFDNFQSTEVECRIVNEDGSIRYLHTQFEFELDEKGDPAHIIGFNQDVTRSKLAKIEIQKNIEELKAARDRQTIILNAMPPNVVLLNESGEIVAVNESWRKFTLANNLNVPGDGIGFSYLAIVERATSVDASAVKRFEKGIREVIAGTRNEFSMEYSYYSQNKEVWFQLIIVPLRDKAQKGAVVLHIDITDRKISELERDRMTADLVQHNTDLEKFAYIISHNLRAPVANIIGASSILNNIELSSADKEKLNRGINTSVMRLDEVINDLNQILQIKGGIDEIKETVLFSELVEHIKISIRNLIDKDNIEIKYDFSEANELFALKPYLYSIFFNLISNSVKYRRQEVHSTIEIQSRLQKNKIELVFSDNGMGIDLKKYGDQIFGLYKRFHSNIEGKGMGLFMVKTQVEMLGGKISVKSEENKGTEFKIEFKI